MKHLVIALQYKWILSVFLFSLIAMSNVSQADVASTTGTIHFDSNSDGASEMTLNSTGLGISTLNPTQALEVQGNATTSTSMSIGGTSSGGSNLFIQGSFALQGATVSSNTSLGDSSVVFANTASANVMLTLPYAGNVIGQKFMIKKTSLLNTAYIVCSANTQIDSTYGVALGAGNMGRISLISTGNQQWHILSVDSSSDLWNPSQLTTAIWFDGHDSSSIITSNSGNVTQWNDKSGNNRHAIQNTATARPKYNSSGINGRGSIAFDGVDDILAVGGTAFLVRSTFSVVNADYGATFPAYNWFFGSSTVTKVAALFGSSGTANFASGLPAQGSANNTTYVNGVQTDSFSPLSDHKIVGAVGNSDSVARSDWTVGGGDTRWDGDVVELIALTSAIATSDRQKLEGYLAWKWGLSEKLDVSHPYRNNPPL